MGIKDWFGGDRKKAAYREKVKEAVADGKLDSRDLEQLEVLRRELNVSDASADRTVMRRALYDEAVEGARAKGRLSATGVHELVKIQKFLALRDDQVQKARWNLARLRTLTEIRQGRLPHVPDSSASLRGAQLDPGETAHYSLAVDVLDQASTRQADGVRMAWSTRYEENSAQGHVLPEDGAKVVGEGTLVLTNQRLILKTGARIAAVRYSADAQVFLYSDGLRLQRTLGHTLLRFRSRSDETPEIVGELLARLMR